MYRIEIKDSGDNDGIWKTEDIVLAIRSLPHLCVGRDVLSIKIEKVKEDEVKDITANIVFVQK